MVSAEDLELSAKSSILIEASTGKVLNETNADEKLHPASMTKVMTMLLIMEALESGKINLVITKDLSRLGRDYLQTGYYT